MSGCTSCGGSKKNHTVNKSVVSTTISTPLSAPSTLFSSNASGCAPTLADVCKGTPLPTCEKRCEAIYNPSVVNVRNFIIPACGETSNFYYGADLYNFTNLPAGAYISSGLAGWYEIIENKADECILVVRNNCECPQPADPGDVIACNTAFLISSKPCLSETIYGGSEFLRTYLCSTFYIPAFDRTVVVKVAINGTGDNSQAVVGGAVRFQGFPFVVVALIGSDKIEIKNIDSANPVGQEINAGLGCNSIVAAFGSATSPCDATPVDKGKIIVCAGDSNLLPIVAPRANMALVSESNGNVSWVDFPQAANCFSLSNTLVLLPAIDYSNGVSIVTTTASNFEVGRTVEINGRSFSLVQVLNSTTYLGVPTFAIASTITINPGAAVCRGCYCGCPHASRLINISGTSTGTITVHNTGDYLLSTLTMTYVNPSPCREANVSAFIEIVGAFRLGANGIFQLQFRSGASIIYTHLVDTLNGGAMHQDNPGFFIPWNVAHTGGTNILGAGQSHSATLTLYCNTQDGVGAGNATLNCNLIMRGLVVTK